MQHQALLAQRQVVARHLYKVIGFANDGLVPAFFKRNDKRIIFFCLLAAISRASCIGCCILGGHAHHAKHYSTSCCSAQELQIYTGFHRHYPVQNATPALWFAIYPVGVAARVQVTQGFIVLFCPAVSGFCNLMEWQHHFFPFSPISRLTTGCYYGLDV